MVAPILAAKAAQNASKPLTGDIYVRRWTTTKGKGKKRKEVEHEVHVNPLTLLLAGAAGAAAAGFAAIGLWATQQKVGKVAGAVKSKVRYVRLYKTAYDKDGNITRQPRYVVYTDRMIPIRTVAYTAGSDLPVLSKHESAAGWLWVPSGEFPAPITQGEDQLGSYTQYRVALWNEKKHVYGLSPRAGLLE